MKRIVLLALVALAIAACTRVVVLDPQPDSGGLPDALHGNDGGGDGGSGFLPDAGAIGDAGTLG